MTSSSSLASLYTEILGMPGIALCSQVPTRFLSAPCSRHADFRSATEWIPFPCSRCYDRAQHSAMGWNAMRRDGARYGATRQVRMGQLRPTHRETESAGSDPDPPTAAKRFPTPGNSITPASSLSPAPADAIPLFCLGLLGAEASAGAGSGSSSAELGGMAP
jgi:hypothetical protein